MGFSKGGFVALYSALTRFQRLHGPAAVRFAHHIAYANPLLASAGRRSGTCSSATRRRLGRGEAVLFAGAARRLYWLG